MEIKIEVDPEKEPDLYERLLNASKILAEIVGPRADQFVTTVAWSQAKDSGPLGPKEAIRLKMTDLFSGTKEEMFQPVELRSPGHMRSRLRDVWGDFLRQLSDEQRLRLDASFAALAEDQREWH
jgi:hypothetical protein